MGQNRGLGLVGAGGRTALREFLRRREAEDAAARQREFMNQIELRRQAVEEQDSQTRRDEHSAMMQEREANRTRLIQGERDTAAGRAFPMLGIGDAVEAPVYNQTYKGTPYEAGFTPERTLPSTQTAGGMAAPDVQSSQAPPMLQGRMMPAPVQTTQESPRMPTGRMVAMGTDQQRTEAANKQRRQQLLQNPNITDRERLAIELENAGMKVPAGVFEPKPSGTLYQVEEGGKPVFRPGDQAAGKPAYHPPPQGGIQTDDATAIAEAIARGEQPPETTGLYRYGASVRAILAKRGYNLATAQQDWRATQRHFATLNGSQQTRMRQAVDNAYHSLDVIEDLAGQWRGGKFPILNRASLLLAKGGAQGPVAQQIATNLEAQIADVASELGNVYMGGNSPTDHALSMAAKNLSADWTETQLKSALNLARRNLEIRQNSIRNTGVVGASDTNPYAGGSGGTTPRSGGGTASSGGTVKMRAPDGRSLNVPADKVAEMEAHGAKRVP
jgi:hypothetical protein